MDSIRTEIKYSHIVAWVAQHPWAILEVQLEKILSLIQLRAAGLTLTEQEIQARVGRGQSRKRASSSGAVAVVPVFGTIAHRMNMFNDISGGTSTEMLGKAIRNAVDDSDVGSVVLDIDSPGGSVYGVEELHREIMAMRGDKPIVAVANAEAGSAAYYIASAADEIVVTPSGTVGSIGVLGVHWDRSKQLEDEGVKPTIIHAGKHKVEGNPYGPLEDDALIHFQKEMDDYHTMFVKAVSRGRAVPVKDVRGERFGEGRMFMAKDALDRGMVDRIDTMDNTISRLARGGGKVAGEVAEPAAVNEMSENFLDASAPAGWVDDGAVAEPRNCISPTGAETIPDPERLLFWDKTPSLETLRAEIDNLEGAIRVRKDLA